MQTRAPKGQYRVIGLDPIDTLTWPSGPLWKDCETLDQALDLADHHRALYLWSTYTMTLACSCTRRAATRSSLKEFESWIKNLRRGLKRNSRKARFNTRSHHHLALVSPARVLAQTTIDHVFASFALPV